MIHVLQVAMALAVSAITMFILDGSASETFIAAIVTLVYLEPKEA
jgi:hypothetical protein